MMLKQIGIIDYGAGACNDVMNQENLGAETNPSAGKVKGERQMTLLPEFFCPSDRDVICGRGCRVFVHSGNEHFRNTVIAGRLVQYSNATSKIAKSNILYDVVAQVRSNSPTGGFVKTKKDGRWYEVGDFLSREKVSQAFRDALHGQYKSSNEYKKQRRLASTSQNDAVLVLLSTLQDEVSPPKRRCVASDGRLDQSHKQNKASKAVNRAQSAIYLSTRSSEFEDPSSLAALAKSSIMGLLTVLDGQAHGEGDPFEPTPIGMAV
jgi:hypothetical protein